MADAEQVFIAEPDLHPVPYPIIDAEPADRRHPATVTADRIDADFARWPDKFTPRERDAAVLVAHALAEIAAGRR